jgi:hypothetical protein
MEECHRMDRTIDLNNDHCVFCNQKQVFEAKHPNQISHKEFIILQENIYDIYEINIEKVREQNVE